MGGGGYASAYLDTSVETTACFGYFCMSSVRVPVLGWCVEAMLRMKQCCSEAMLQGCARTGMTHARDLAQVFIIGVASIGCNHSIVQRVYIIYCAMCVVSAAE